MTIEQFEEKIQEINRMSSGNLDRTDCGFIIDMMEELIGEYEQSGITES